MVLNNLTKFHKILIKTIRLREQTLLGVTYGHMDRRTYPRKGQHLMPRPLSWGGGGIKSVQNFRTFTIIYYINNATYRPLNHKVSTKTSNGSNIRRILLRSIRINSADFLCVSTWKTLSNLVCSNHTECVIGPGSQHDIGCILRTVNCFSRHPLVGVE